MKPASDIDEIEPELFDQLIEYRTRAYENLANDALSLLSIQLLILPISLSVSSLLIEVINRSNTATDVSTITALVSEIDYFLFRWGVISGLVSILLAAITYHFSRKRAADQSYFLIQRYQPEIIGADKPRSATRERLTNLVDLGFERLGSDPPDTRPELTADPRDSESPISFARAFLTVSLMGTLLSIVLIVLALFKSVYSDTMTVFTYLVGFAVLIFFYLAVTSSVLLLAESLMGGLRSAAVLIGSYVIRVSQHFGIFLAKLCRQNPLASLFIILYPILVLTSTTLSSEFLSVVLSVIGVCLGISGLLLSAVTLFSFKYG